MENVMITGHKNPDTDSICSSLSYAFIKKALGEDVTACRAGNVNAETQFVLDYWKVEPPVLVEKVEKDQKVILVDHNEAAQAVDGLEDAEITEIVDHHRLGGALHSGAALCADSAGRVHLHDFVPDDRREKRDAV